MSMNAVSTPVEIANEDGILVKFEGILLICSDALKLINGTYPYGEQIA